MKVNKYDYRQKWFELVRQEYYITSHHRNKRKVLYIQRTNKRLIKETTNKQTIKEEKLEIKKENNSKIDFIFTLWLLFQLWNQLQILQLNCPL